jgi:hypothetical protein
MKTAEQNRIVRFLPSLTDAAFLVPLLFLFVRLSGGHFLLGDGDTGWHLRTGEWILQNGRVPDRDIFSYTKAGEPWFAWEWLWDLTFGWLHLHAGMAAVLAASILVLCCTYAILFRLVRRYCSNVLLAFALTVFAAAGSSMHWLARPHLFTLLFVAVFCSVLQRVQEGKTRLLFWLPPLMLLWTNLHGGFFIGIFLIGCYGAGELATWLVEKDRVLAKSALLRSRPYLATAAACAALTLVNPYFYHLHQHVWHFLGSPTLYMQIDEFKGTNFQSPQAVYFEPLILLGILAAAWSFYNKRFADGFIVAAWVHLGLFSVRNMPIYLLVATPVVGRMLHAQLTRLEAAPLAAWVSRITRSSREFAAEFGATDRLPRVHLTSAVALLAVCGMFYLPAPPPKFRAEYDPTVFPTKALKLFQDPESAVHVFTSDLWGGYMIYRLYPRTKVFVDGRSDMYGEAFAKKCSTLFNAQHGWEQTLASYGVTAVMLPVDAPLTGALKESRRWRPAYDDGIAIVFQSAQTLPGAAAGKDARASASAGITPDGRNQRGREITNSSHSDPRITKPKTRSEFL